MEYGKQMRKAEQKRKAEYGKGSGMLMLVKVLGNQAAVQRMIRDDGKWSPSPDTIEQEKKTVHSEKNDLIGEEHMVVL